MKTDIKIHKGNESGYTLVELVLVIALIGLIGSAILQLTVFGTKQYSHIKDEAYGSQEAAFIIDYIAAEIRRNDQENCIEVDSVNNTVLLKGTFNIGKETSPITINQEEYSYQKLYHRDNKLVATFHKAQLSGGNEVPDYLPSQSSQEIMITETTNIQNIAISKTTREVSTGLELLTSITIDISYNVGTRTETLSSVIGIRSHNKN